MQIPGLRSSALAALLAMATLARPTLAQSQGPLKISHQFPGGTIDEGDFRDRLTGNTFSPCATPSSPSRTSCRR